MEKKRTGWLGILSIALVLLKKQAVLINAVKMLKLLKVAKPLVMVLSILVSVIAYGWLYGSWWFAGGLVAMIFIHEMGHVIALRREGLPPSPMVFIPFLGAAIFVPVMKTRHTEAVVGIGGPVLGTIGALAAFAVWALVPGQSDLWLLVSYVGLVLNLFNLVPISPLDGGRITQICGAWIKYVGLALVLTFLALSRQPSMILILILVLDAFNGMPRWWRPILSGILTIMMTTLFAMNIGTQHWLIDIFDVVMASFFTLTYWLYDRNNERVVQEYEDDQTLTRADRLKWFGYWIALVALLVGMLYVQAPYMPKQVLENARLMAQ